MDLREKAVKVVRDYDAGLTLRSHECFDVARAYLAEYPNPSVEGEIKALEFRKSDRELGDGKPNGTVESLARCASMLDTYAPECFPANEHGQIHFVRAMMESVSDEIRAYLKALGIPLNPTSNERKGEG